MSTKEKRKSGGKVYRYSEAFKHRVVQEIEKGDLTIIGARTKYGIKGGSTVQGWIRKMGKNHLLNRVVRIETPDEMSQYKLQQARIEELEKALAQTQLECLQSEAYLRLACEQLGVELETFKKKQVSKPKTSPNLSSSTRSSK